MPRCEISVPCANSHNRYLPRRASRSTRRPSSTDRSATGHRRRCSRTSVASTVRRSTAGASARRVTSTSGSSGIGFRRNGPGRSDNVGTIPLAACFDARASLMLLSFARRAAELARLIPLLTAVAILGCATRPAATGPAPTDYADRGTDARRRRPRRRPGTAGASAKPGDPEALPEVPITGALYVSADGGGTRGAAGRARRGLFDLSEARARDARSAPGAPRDGTRVAGTCPAAECRGGRIVAPACADLEGGAAGARSAVMPAAAASTMPTPCLLPK